MMKAVLKCLVFSLAISVFESAALANIYFLPVVPDFLLIFVIFASFFTGRTLGISVAFFSGLLADCVSMSPFGLSSLVLLPVAFACGAMRHSFAADNFLFQILLVGGATLAKAAMLVFLSFFYGESVHPYDLAESSFWIEMTFNMALAPVCFKFFSQFAPFLRNSFEVAPNEFE